MLSLSHILESQLRVAMAQAFPAADGPLDPQMAPASKPEFGDFQANGALPLAKPLKQPPRQQRLSLLLDIIFPERDRIQLCSRALGMALHVHALIHFMHFGNLFL